MSKALNRIKIFSAYLSEGVRCRREATSVLGRHSGRVWQGCKECVMPGKNWLGIATVATPHSETTGHHGHSQSERETRRVNRTAQKESQTERDELWLAMPPATHLLTNTHWRQRIQGNAEHSLIIFTHSKKISNISMQKTSFVYLPVQQILWVASWNILSFLFFFLYFLLLFFFLLHSRELRPWISVLRCIELKYLACLAPIA